MGWKEKQREVDEAARKLKEEEKEKEEKKGAEGIPQADASQKESMAGKRSYMAVETLDVSSETRNKSRNRSSRNIAHKKKTRRSRSRLRTRKASRKHRRKKRVGVKRGTERLREKEEPGDAAEDETFVKGEAKQQRNLVKQLRR